MNRYRPAAASIPWRTAQPLPAWGIDSTRTGVPGTASRPSTTLTVSSALPSSTTTISRE